MPSYIPFLLVVVVLIVLITLMDVAIMSRAIKYIVALPTMPHRTTLKVITNVHGEVFNTACRD
jgi:hypothetical protein